MVKFMMKLTDDESGSSTCNFSHKNNGVLFEKKGL